MWEAGGLLALMMSFCSALACGSSDTWQPCTEESEMEEAATEVSFAAWGPFSNLPLAIISPLCIFPQEPLCASSPKTDCSGGTRLSRGCRKGSISHILTPVRCAEKLGSPRQFLKVPPHWIMVSWPRGKQLFASDVPLFLVNSISVSLYLKYLLLLLVLNFSRYF